MATRSFWKVQSTKDKTGTPSTTPSTSLNDGSDAPVNLDISAASLRTSDGKVQVSAGVLTAAALESVFLWKQPSKRRLFGGSNPQKRYFVLTPNELGYKEKDSEDSEFKMIWKIGSGVLRVEPPGVDGKEFNVIVNENGAPRAMRLSATDAATAQKFASAMETALKASSVPKSIPAPSVHANTTMDELSIEDSKVSTTTGQEQPSAIETIEEISVQSSLPDVEVTVSALTEPETEALVPIGDEEVKPSVWFWGMCCSAE